MQHGARIRDYERMERAIAFLDSRRGPQPRLAEVARAVGLSEYHFQRLFTRWAGVSPKRFLQFAAAARARALFDASVPVLAAAYETGVSSSGRLHDLTVTVDAVTPGELRRGGAGLTISWGVHESPFGEAVFGVTSRGICWLGFLKGDGGVSGHVAAIRNRFPNAVLERDERVTGVMAARVFPSGRSAQDTPIPLLVRGTNFQLRVWEALLRIPEGCVATYEQVAAAAGNPAAVRAAASAVASNPVGYLIPCHRVIRKTGAFGQYQGGALRKQAILLREWSRHSSSPDVPARRAS